MDNLTIPRVHGGGTSAHPYWVREGDGTRFDGVVKPKRIKQKTLYGTFVRAFVDSKGRWYDNAGMPMAKPSSEVEDDD
jgi:hypothetical protein